MTRVTQFDITVASELMAILALATRFPIPSLPSQCTRETSHLSPDSMEDMKERFERIVVASDRR